MAANILFISYDGLTDALGQSQILAYQKQISSTHFIITILSYEKEDNFKKNAGIVKKQCDSAGIKWVPLKYTRYPPVISTLMDLNKGWRKIKKLNKSDKFDIIHCRGYVPSILGERCKNELGIPFIFDMRGWWPDEKLESGAWSSVLFRPVYHYFKYKERRFFKNSSVTVSLTEAGKKEISRLDYKEEKNIRIVPTCTDLSLFDYKTEDERKELREKLNYSENHKILIYSGALGGNYPAEDIFIVLKAFLELSPLHHCIILSKESLPENLTLPERTIIKSVNYSEVSQYLAIGDMGLIYYTRAYSNIGRCPTKLGEYWASGLKVICPSGIGDLDWLFKYYAKTGYTVDNWNKTEITFALNNILNETIDRLHLRNAALDYFSLEKGVNFYKNLYISLIDKQNSETFDFV